MGAKVVAVIRAYPKGVVENLEKIVNKIVEVLPKDKYALLKWEPVDIAFGYRAIDLYIMMPEELEGGTEELEEKIKSVEDVENVDVQYITRVL